MSRWLQSLLWFLSGAYLCGVFWALSYRNIPAVVAALVAFASHFVTAVNELGRDQ